MYVYLCINQRVSQIAMNILYIYFFSLDLIFCIQNLKNHSTLWSKIFFLFVKKINALLDFGFMDCAETDKSYNFITILFLQMTN